MSEVILFVPEWPALDSPVLHAQVLSFGGFLDRSGIRCRFVGAESTAERASQACELIRRRFGLEACVYPVLKVGARATDMWRACGAVARELQRTLLTSQATHIYTRSFVAAHRARRIALKCGLVGVHDVRGLVGEEQFLRDGNGLKRLITGLLERQAINGATRVAAVSNALQKHIHGWTGRADAVVIPSCFDDATFRFSPQGRAQIRDEFGFESDQIVLCYSGGVDRWQRIDDVLDLLQAVCRLDSRCRALLLTREREVVERKLQQRGFPASRAVVRSCAHDQMPRFLSAADVGVIMRNDIAVNNVASPIKVAEYLGCGLPVVLTNGIGDYSEQLPLAGIAVRMDESRPLAQQVLDFVTRPDLEVVKTAAQAYAVRHLTLAANLPHYERLYGAGAHRA